MVDRRFISNEHVILLQHLVQQNVSVVVLVGELDEFLVQHWLQQVELLAGLQIEIMVVNNEI